MLRSLSRFAQELAEVVKPFRPLFYEEPLRPENIAAMARLKQKIDIPLATGECLVTKYQFRDLIAANAADILQPDLLLCGGLLEAKKIAALAEADYLTVALTTPWGRFQRRFRPTLPSALLTF